MKLYINQNKHTNTQTTVFDILKYNVRPVGASICERDSAHTAHHTENILARGVDANFSGVGALNGGVGENDVKIGVIDTREIASAGGLDVLGSDGE